jgi:serine/threonine protein kinase
MIGEGAFSKVYKIKQNNNFYAVKYYERPELINEIACLKLLKNNNIITLEDFKMHEEGAFLFFEYAEYNLNQIVVMKTILYQKKLIDYKTIILSLFQDILKAVSYCHHNDVIHGDIKPINIVWVNDHLKLIDLGSSLPYGSYRQNYSNVMLPKRITT